MDIGSISTLTQQLSCSYPCFLVIAGLRFKGQETNSFPLTCFFQFVEAICCAVGLWYWGICSHQYSFSCTDKEKWKFIGGASRMTMSECWTPIVTRRTWVSRGSGVRSSYGCKACSITIPDNLHVKSGYIKKDKTKELKSDIFCSPKSVLYIFPTSSCK